MLNSHHISLQLARELERERIASGRAWRLSEDARTQPAQVPAAPATEWAHTADPPAIEGARAVDRRPRPVKSSEPACECETPLRISRRAPARALLGHDSAHARERAGDSASW
jgi:hypothetical protein